MITLHQEIISILSEAGISLTTHQIAELVSKRKNYSKRDGSDMTAYQIHGRTKNYKKLFDRNGSTVMLKDQKQNIEKDITITKEKNITEKITLEKDEEIIKVDYLDNAGFINIGELGELIKTGLPLEDGLNYSGCYALTKPTNYEPEFINPEEATSNGNVINPWEVEKLEKKWVENVDVVYFGIAGIRSNRSLKRRLKDLLKHGNGQTTDRGPHKGGEIFWQLKGYQNFSLWILPIKNPRNNEESYLENFYKQTGQLPFANRQF